MLAGPSSAGPNHFSLHCSTSLEVSSSHTVLTRGLVKNRDSTIGVVVGLLAFEEHSGA
jgi:hypothetical protein